MISSMRESIESAKTSSGEVSALKKFLRKNGYKRQPLLHPQKLVHEDGTQSSIYVFPDCPQGGADCVVLLTGRSNKGHILAMKENPHLTDVERFQEQTGRVPVEIPETKKIPHLLEVFENRGQQYRRNQGWYDDQTRVFKVRSTTGSLDDRVDEIQSYCARKSIPCRAFENEDRDRLLEITTNDREFHRLMMFYGSSLIPVQTPRPNSGHRWIQKAFDEQEEQGTEGAFTRYVAANFTGPNTPEKRKRVAEQIVREYERWSRVKSAAPPPYDIKTYRRAKFYLNLAKAGKTLRKQRNPDAARRRFLHAEEERYRHSQELPHTRINSGHRLYSLINARWIVDYGSMVPTDRYGEAFKQLNSVRLIDDAFKTDAEMVEAVKRVLPQAIEYGFNPSDMRNAEISEFGAQYILKLKSEFDPADTHNAMGLGDQLFKTSRAIGTLRITTPEKATLLELKEFILSLRSNPHTRINTSQINASWEIEYGQIIRGDYGQDYEVVDRNRLLFDIFPSDAEMVKAVKSVVPQAIELGFIPSDMRNAKITKLWNDQYSLELESGFTRDDLDVAFGTLRIRADKKSTLSKLKKYFMSLRSNPHKPYIRVNPVQAFNDFAEFSEYLADLSDGQVFGGITPLIYARGQFFDVASDGSLLESPYSAAEAFQILNGLPVHLYSISEAELADLRAPSIIADSQRELYNHFLNLYEELQKPKRQRLIKLPEKVVEEITPQVEEIIEQLEEVVEPEPIVEPEPEPIVEPEPEIEAEEVAELEQVGGKRFRSYEEYYQAQAELLKKVEQYRGQAGASIMLEQMAANADLNPQYERMLEEGIKPSSEIQRWLLNEAESGGFDKGNTHLKIGTYRSQSQLEMTYRVFRIRSMRIGKARNKFKLSLGLRPFVHYTDGTYEINFNTEPTKLQISKRDTIIFGKGGMSSGIIGDIGYAKIPEDVFKQPPQRRTGVAPTPQPVVEEITQEVVEEPTPPQAPPSGLTQNEITNIAGIIAGLLKNPRNNSGHFGIAHRRPIDHIMWVEDPENSDVLYVAPAEFRVGNKTVKVSPTEFYHRVYHKDERKIPYNMRHYVSIIRLDSDRRATDTLKQQVYTMILDALNEKLMRRNPNHSNWTELYFGIQDMMVGGKYKGDFGGQTWYFEPTHPISKSGKIKGLLLSEDDRFPTIKFIGKKTNFDGIKWFEGSEFPESVERKFIRKRNPQTR